MTGLDLLARACPAREEAHHLGIRVERDLPLEVLVGERYQGEPPRVQRPLRHGCDCAAPRPELTAPDLPMRMAGMGAEPTSTDGRTWPFLVVGAGIGFVLGILVSIATDVPLAPEAGLVIGALAGWLGRRMRT